MTFAAHAASLAHALTPEGAALGAGARESLISTRVILELVEAAEQAGVTRDALFHAAGLDVALLDTLDARLPRSDLYRLCERALELTGDPAFGLHWAERLSDRAFVPISHLLAHASSLRHAFELLAQFSRLLADQTDYRIDELGDAIALRCLPMEGESERLRRTAAEIAVGGFWRLVRSFSVDVRPEQVCFAYAAPEHRDAYTRFFAGEVRFEQPFTGIVFDRALLDVPSRTKDDDVREAMEAIAERRLLQLTREAPYALRVRDHIVREGWPHRTDMTSVAQALGLSVRSLRRRLEDEQRSYNDVLNEALSVVAKQRVLDVRRTTQEIAYEMGFADTSAFYRAFKRWTGTTPSAYRDAGRK